MEIKNLLKNIDGQLYNIRDTIHINGISSNSREIKKGDIFIAVKGYEADGHDYIDQAVEKGAAAVVAEKYKGENNIPLILVKDSRKVRATLAREYYGDPGKNLDIIGVTGTNGKTTVCLLMESNLQAQGKSTGLLTTLYYRWNQEKLSAQRTTPDTLDIYKYLYEMKNQGITTVVMEVSSHALSLYRVEGLEFKAAVFTNISRDHLEFHRTMDNYAEAKSLLFTKLHSEGVGVVHGDDKYAETMIRAANQRVVTYGKASDNDYRIGDITLNRDHLHFTLTHKNKKVTVNSPLKGYFNILNGAAAAVTGIETGGDISAVKKGIEQVKTVPGRMEYIESKQGFLVIVDYAHTPAAVGNILSEVKKFTPRRVLAVFGCGGDRDRGKRPLMGQEAVEHADYTIVTTDNPRTENPAEIISQIMEGIETKKDVTIIEDRKEAIHYALDMASRGDSVVLLGKGHETYQEIGTQRFPFDDKKIAKEYLGL